MRNLRILLFTWRQPTRSININVPATLCFLHSKRHDAKHSNFAHTDFDALLSKARWKYVIWLLRRPCIQLSHLTCTLRCQSDSPDKRVRDTDTICPCPASPQWAFQGWWNYGTRAQNGKREVLLDTRHSPLFQNFYFSRSASLYYEEYVYTYTHIPDHVEIVYELPLLPNNTTSEVFSHQSQAVRSIAASVV
jgi:hypothetical protein